MRLECTLPVSHIDDCDLVQLNDTTKCTMCTQPSVHLTVMYIYQMSVCLFVDPIQIHTNLC